MNTLYETALGRAVEKVLVLMHVNGPWHSKRGNRADYAGVGGTKIASVWASSLIC